MYFSGFLAGLNIRQYYVGPAPASDVSPFTPKYINLAGLHHRAPAECAAAEAATGQSFRCPEVARPHAGEWRQFAESVAQSHQGLDCRGLSNYGVGINKQKIQ
jgi:hypothetical protein